MEKSTKTRIQRWLWKGKTKTLDMNCMWFKSQDRETLMPTLRRQRKDGQV